MKIIFDSENLKNSVFFTYSPKNINIFDGENLKNLEFLSLIAQNENYI